MRDYEKEIVMNAAVPLKRVLLCFVGFLVAFGFVGCTNTNLQLPEVSTPQRPSFPLPELRTPSAPRPAAMLYGQWEGVQMYGSDGNVFTGTLGYAFFDDGTCLQTTIAGDCETMSGGKWSYDQDILTMSLDSGFGKEETLQYKLLWYSDDQFEIRYADLRNYEKMCKAEGVESVSCTYDDRGCLTTRTTLRYNGMVSVTTMVASPLIVERKR